MGGAAVVTATSGANIITLNIVVIRKANNISYSSHNSQFIHLG